MTKLILLCLILTSTAFAQNADELTLESTTAPTVVEDGTDVAQASTPESEDPAFITTPVATPDEETVGAQDADLEDKESTEMTASNAKDTPQEPAQLPVATSIPPAGETQTPNPLETRSDKPGGLKEYVTGTVPYDAHKLDHRKSHLQTTFGFEGQKYNLTFADFTGVNKRITARDQELYGARLGFGGQLYLGAGFFTTSNVSVFYSGTLFTKSQEAGPTLEGVQVGAIKRTSGFTGADLSQQLGYIFEFRTKNPFMDEWSRLTFEPFVEAGLGMGTSYNKVNYFYNSGPAAGPSQVDEFYKYTIEDKVTFAKAGGGFNITAGNGFFMQAKVLVSTMNITERKTKGAFRHDDDASITTIAPSTDKNAKMNPQTVYTLGGGYKF